jgi:murein L,D-transpeptidase YcbB/YkuD
MKKVMTFSSYSIILWWFIVLTIGDGVGSSVPVVPRRGYGDCKPVASKSLCQCKYEPLSISVRSGTIEKQLNYLYKSLYLFQRYDQTMPFSPINDEQPLSLGDQGPKVMALKKLLIYHQYPEKNLSMKMDHDRFDQPNQDEVKKFQRRHCLSPDGVVGKKTYAALNMNYKQRIQWIEKNIDRLKKISFESPCVIVNIPTYHLTTYAASQNTLFMPVVVGKKKKKTPIMTVWMDGVVLNPYWVMPQSILKDYLFFFKKDHGYLKKKGYYVLNHQGQRVDDRFIDWDGADAAAYKVCQAPGARNALGVMKFHLKNSQAIFLHDTPSRRSFDCIDRSFSSGCVRLFRYQELLHWCLEQEHGNGNVYILKKNRIQKILQSLKTKFVSFSTPIRVHFLYLTNWVEDDGTVWFNDPYHIEAQVPQQS